MTTPPDKSSPFKIGWQNWVLLALAIVGAVFQIIGPLSDETLRGIPIRLSALLQGVSVFLSANGSRILAFSAGAFVWWQRRFFREVYIGFVATLIAPVLETRRAKVYYGYVVVLRHLTTGRYLSSSEGHIYMHPGGSGQQVVFGSSCPEDDSLWVIQSAHGRNPRERDGKEVMVGDQIRILHLATRTYLHSHANVSQLSVPLAAGDQQREVTASSQDNIQDEWEVVSKDNYMFGVKWRLMHSDGGQYLHSHDRVLPLKGRSAAFEVTCCSDKNDDDFWVITRARYMRYR